MNKFIFSSLLNELYQEILYVTYNYQKEKISSKDIQKLNNTDYKNLSKSKVIINWYNAISSSGLFNDSKYYIDDKLLTIIETRDYNLESLNYIVDYLNPYIDFYRETMMDIIDNISGVIDLKLKETGFNGEYPLYIKLEEKRCVLERAIITTNANDYLTKSTKQFGLKVTFMDYDVPLEDFKFKDTDLRNKTNDEILKLMESSVKVELNNSKYYVTDILTLDKDSEEIDLSNKGKISLWLNKKSITFGGLKDALKGSLKHTLFMLLIIVVVTIVMLIIKYLK